MKYSNRILILPITLLVLSSISLPAQARFKCWTNKEGVRECGEKVPPEYAQQGHKEYDKRGMVREETERAKTEEELVEEARLAKIEAEKLKAEEEQARKDKILLDTFSNVNDIELARDGKIDALQSTINLAKKRISKIQEDLDKRIKAAAAQERAGKTPNQALLKDIESLKRQIKNNKEFIDGKHKEQEDVKAAYTKDIERFKKLTGDS